MHGPPPPDDGWARHRRRLVWGIGLVLVAGVLAGSLAWWLDRGRHYFSPKNWGVVEEGRIYRSGQIHRGIVEDVLRGHDIRVIVDLTRDEATDPDAVVERNAAHRLGIRKVELVGLNGYGTGDPQDYVLALREIVAARDRGEPVLVHCAGGSERTGGILACYRMLFEGWDGPSAWEEYVSYRSKPPEREDLQRFVNENLPWLVKRLQALGVLLEAPDALPHFGPADED